MMHDLIEVLSIGVGGTIGLLLAEPFVKFIARISRYFYNRKNTKTPSAEK